MSPQYSCRAVSYTHLHRKPAIAYDKESKGARAYLHLAGELIKREEKAAKAAQEAAAAATEVKHG